jgi:telomere resolvase
MRVIPVPLNNLLLGAPFTKPPSRRDQPEEPVVLDFGARAQDFLKRIIHLSADLAARGRTRTLEYRNAIRAVDPDHLVLRPRKMHSGQRFSYLALEPEETRALNAAYHQSIHRDQSNLIPLDPEAFIQTALELLSSDRYLQKGMGLMALTGRRPAEIFFSATFSLPPKKLPYPALLFDGQLKTRQAPGTSFEPYPIPVLGDPKKLVQALETLRSLKSFPSPKAVNTTTGPQLPKYVSAAFGSLDLPWKPGHSAQPTAPSVATSSNPKTRPPISSSPKSSAINYSDQTHPSP